METHQNKNMTPNAFTQFINALNAFKRDPEQAQPNLCIMQEDLYRQLFLEASAMFKPGDNFAVTESPPHFELNDCLILPSKGTIKVALFARWPQLEMYRKLAAHTEQLVPLLVDAEAIAKGVSKDGGDPLTVKSIHDDVAGKSAERAIGRLIRELRKLF